MAKLRLVGAAVAALLLGTACGGGGEGEAAPADHNEPTGPDLAQTGKVSTVSSEYDASFGAAKAIDGDLGTEWSSKGDGNKATITVDLGTPKKVVALEFISRSMGDGT